MLRKTSRALLTAFLAIALIGCGSAEDPDGDDTNHVNVDPGNDDPGNDDPGNDDPGNDDPGNDDPGNDDPGNDDPGNDDPGNDDPGNDDPGNDDPGNDEPGNTGEPTGEDLPGEILQSTMTRDTDPDVDDATFADFTADNREFAFSLFSELRESEEDDENIFFSPHSISIALAMTYGGAENETRAQMSEALRFNLDDEQLHPAFNKLDLELAKRSEIELEEEEEEEEDQALALDVINQTWGQEGFDFVDDYLDMLALNYGAKMSLVDFILNYEEIRQDINQWVEAQTNERIVDLLPQNSLDDTVRFILVNAIYFYGSWSNPFNEDMTSDQDFSLLDGSTAQVPMMTQDAHYGFFEDPDEETVAVSLPYVGEEVSMIAFMPLDESDDFGEWESSFGQQDFDAVVDGLVTQRVMLSFPRFEDDAEFELKETFEALGMIDAFDECAADFEGITGHPPCIDFASLYIDEIYHQSFVSVDEEGTEAAAATGVVTATPTSIPPPLSFDRPFYYAIYDHPTDTILFMGRMVDPS